MVEVRTANLTGKALTWAAIVALGLEPVIAATGICHKNDAGGWTYPIFESPFQVAELIEREWIGLERPSKGQKAPMWRAITDRRFKKKLRPGDSDVLVVDAWGETSFLAVARVFVMSRLGACVTIPAELAA